jgi:hypothetical protein
MTGILNFLGLREFDRRELEDEYHVIADQPSTSRLNRSSTMAKYSQLSSVHR